MQAMRSACRFEPLNSGGTQGKSAKLSCRDGLVLNEEGFVLGETSSMLSVPCNALVTMLEHCCM